eukprot:PLAT7076.2.p1 GENE.PLAT7076.2~~PLAT7076.2.p1  ORF type:complete len:443 (-),score=205.55 PLAT7076.2:17-1345(-)
MRPLCMSCLLARLKAVDCPADLRGKHRCLWLPVVARLDSVVRLSPRLTSCHLSLPPVAGREGSPVAAGDVNAALLALCSAGCQCGAMLPAADDGGKAEEADGGDSVEALLADVEAGGGGSAVAVRALVKLREGYFEPAVFEAMQQGSEPLLAAGALLQVYAFPELLAEEEGGCVLHMVAIARAAAGEPPLQPPARAISVKESESLRPRVHHAPAGGGGGGGARKGKRNRVKKNNRATKFVNWLIARVGVDALRRGSGVLDVAGGSGEVAFILCYRWRIPCTVIDPRAMRLGSKQRHWLEKRRERDRLLAAAGQSEFGGGFDSADGEEGGPIVPRQRQQLFDDRFPTAEETADLWASASAVIGMHPDQATDAIVQLSRAHDKPFAVVPCCVFPRLFPRSLDDGSDVRSYDDYCRWLLARGDDMQSELLEFEGRNVVIYGGMDK